jgi:hypothetical protein
MASPPGPYGRPFATSQSPSSRTARRSRLWVCAALLLTAGCGDGGAEERAAYDAALADVAREKVTLHNVKAEQQRLYGEYLLHDFEARAWAGNVAPSRTLRLPWAVGEFDHDPPLYVYLRNKLPLPWFGQLDRLLTEKSQALPWYDRTEGDLHRRRIHERFSRILNVLRDRIALQEDRVRKSEEYAKLIEPEKKPEQK